MKKLIGILLLFSVFSVYAANNNILCSIEYFYSDDGMLIGKAINGNRINYEYDSRGQLLSVKDTNGKILESYTYDKVGNILSKTVNGKTTTYTYDKANQLISSTIDGKITNYKYDAAGRMIQAGSKTYRYKYLDKVAEVRENGKVIAEFEYTVEGQVSTATYGDKTEEFMWDGLALIKRNDISYLNEPYVTGGNPILADNDVMFNDKLGNTVAINGKSIDMTAFGETENTDAMFTGKPHVAELGYAFLFRNYNSSLGKWSTADPLGYPDGWNNFAYCNNWTTTSIDRLGTDIYQFVEPTDAVLGIEDQYIIYVTTTNVLGIGSHTAIVVCDSNNIPIYSIAGYPENYNNSSSSGSSAALVDPGNLVVRENEDLILPENSFLLEITNDYSTIMGLDDAYQDNVPYNLSASSGYNCNSFTYNALLHLGYTEEIINEIPEHLGGWQLGWGKRFPVGVME